MLGRSLTNISYLAFATVTSRRLALFSIAMHGWCVEWLSKYCETHPKLMTCYKMSSL